MSEAKAIINYKGVDTTVLCKTNDKFKDIFNNFGEKINEDVSKIIFLYNGNKINEELKYEEIINNEDKPKRIMKIIGYEMNITEITQKKIINSNNIICKDCKENTLIKIENYKINMYNCKNGHNIKDIKINEFENTQMIDISKIICNDCQKNNKGNTYNNDFYRCITCNKNICPLCKTVHNNHEIIGYDNINYICIKHKESFTRYCYDCKKNLCIICEEEHNNKHEGINLGKLIILNKHNNLKELKENIDKLKNEIKEIIEKFEYIMINMDKYYNISSNIINKSNNKRNYETLQNINVFINSNNIIIKEIKEIINELVINNKLNKLVNIYNKMNNTTNKIIEGTEINENAHNEEINNIYSFGENKKIWKKKKLEKKLDKWLNNIKKR